MLRRTAISLCVAWSVGACGGAMASAPGPGHLERARAILAEVPLVDGHNDLPWQVRKRVEVRLSELDLARDLSGEEDPLHTDMPRLRAGGVGGVFWSVYVPPSFEGDEAVRMTLEQIDIVHRLIERYPEHLELALTADDVVRIHRAGRIASLIGMEGGHNVNNSLGTLRMMYRLGARYMTLTHWRANDWADAATDSPRHGGLNDFGREVIREMNRLGMLADLSHVAPATMHAVLDVSEAPVIFSHSSAAGVCDHPRNVPDDVLRRLPDNGGLVMVVFLTAFVSCEVRDHWARARGAKGRLESLHPGDRARVERELAAWHRANPEPPVSVREVADHIDYIRDLIGVDHIGLGSDYDGMPPGPLGLEDVSGFPNLVAELLARGYSEDDVKKIIGLNVLRVMRDAESVARRLQGARGPSERTLE